MQDMSIDLTWQIKSISSDSTEAAAAQIGKNLVGGEVIELTSDLGGGKTVFVRGLARGAGSHDEPASPTFTISKVYSCSKFAIQHFDFYRLNDPGIVKLELKEIIGDPLFVTVIEWASIVTDVLPAKRLRIKIDNMGDDNRLLTIVSPPELSYLMEGIEL